MILPAVDSASGAVRSPWPLVDGRVPTEFPRGDDPRLVGAWRQRSDACPTGRHLWDAIETTTSENVPFIADDDVERLRFQMRLTCVRCGLVEHLRGIQEYPYPSESRQVNPVPLQSGALWAQQIDGHDGRSDLSTWAVHDDPHTAPVGVIAWGCGPRGRRYFTGRRFTWLPGASVQGATPQAVLAKLARAGAAYGPAEAEAVP
jgi:hypothetical protein